MVQASGSQSVVPEVATAVPEIWNEGMQIIRPHLWKPVVRDAGDEAQPFDF